MLDEHPAFRLHWVLGWPVDQDDAILVDEPVDDQLHQVLLSKELCLGLDVILHLFHVPGNEVHFLHLLALGLLVSKVGCQHLTYPLVLCKGDLHPPLSALYDLASRWLLCGARSSGLLRGFVGLWCKFDVVALGSLEAAKLELEGLLHILHLDLLVQVHAGHGLREPDETLKLPHGDAAGAADVGPVLAQLLVATDQPLVGLRSDDRPELPRQSDVALQLRLGELRSRLLLPLSMQS
mmetsp:Transcript_61675/g.133597  ORF Transcript_61675/g.133597 Transcript_61675/m.133597 type:complete len:237 (+) Transcript_61675:241-951(+)